jgi:hypothetical protein
MIKKQFTKADFDLMLNALEEHTAGMPPREVMKKLLQLQLERDCAISIADALCNATGDISHIVRGFQVFRETIGA